MGNQIHEEEMEKRVQSYWTARTKDFNAIRQNELHDEIGLRWLAKIYEHLPADRPQDILDAGTGTGYFAILLAKEGHRLTGIDLTESMLEEAKKTAEMFGVDVCFLQRNVQETGMEAERFDAIVSRNVTWTLPDPEKAYREWYRLLKPGGVLLNFDANYADNVRNQNQKESWVTPGCIYGHVGMTQELMKENERITLSMPASEHHRPKWDLELAEQIGFSEYGADETAGKEILQHNDLSDAPMFLFFARK
ncbi:MAG: class I SAM-dependent methyltransferase [Lachnospiraceae bacterium]|nr:class I SAM-dependent methyltransferase [Lachnospiraceae bacterium]